MKATSSATSALIGGRLDLGQRLPQVAAGAEEGGEGALQGADLLGR